MKVIIDVDENVYTRLFDNGVDIEDIDDIESMQKSIRKGVPLWDVLNKYMDYLTYQHLLNDIKRLIIKYLDGVCKYER